MLELEEIQRSLGRIEGKLDSVVTEQNNQRSEMVSHKIDDYANFKNVFASLNFTRGVVALAVFVVPLAVAVIVHYV